MQRLTYEYTKKEIQEHNNNLGPPIWCTVNTDPLSVQINNNLNEIALQRYNVRQQAMTKLFNLFSVDGNNHINLDFINNFYSYFYIDEQCICSGLLGLRPSNYIFQTGRNPIGTGKVGSIYTMNYDNQRLILKSVSNVSVRRYIPLHYSVYNQSFARMNPSIDENVFIMNTSQGTSQRVILYSGSDNFTNQTIQHLILNIILDTLPNYIYQYDAFFCSRNGYNIVEFASGGDLTDYLTNIQRVTTSIARNILRQILLPIKILKQNTYGFVHADLKAKNILVTYDNNRNPIFQIADYDKSSIFWNGVRFHNGIVTVANQTFSIYNFINQIFSSSAYPLQNEEGILYYTLVPSIAYTSVFQLILSYISLEKLYTMYNPYGFYLSYDIYTLFISLMMEPPFYQYILSQQNIPNKDPIYISWYNLWFPDDFPRIMSLIDSEHTTLNSLRNDISRMKIHQSTMRSITNIIKILHDGAYRLKYNVDFIYDLLDVQIPPNVKNIPPIDKPILRPSAGGRICTSPCVNGQCLTNLYSQTLPLYGTNVYNYDYCS